MYHVIANLEKYFGSAEEVLDVFSTDTIIYPKIPRTAMTGEDRTTRRICVAPTIEQCLQGIGLLGVFRRCLEANEDAMSYSSAGREVYPILILSFPDTESYVVPTKDQVPDAEYTGEQWLLTPTKPSSVDLCWLDPWSIKWVETDTPYCPYQCRWVRFVKPSVDNIHPWLTGTGHILDSSEEEKYEYN